MTSKQWTIISLVLAALFVKTLIHFQPSAEPKPECPPNPCNCRIIAEPAQQSFNNEVNQ